MHSLISSGNNPGFWICAVFRLQIYGGAEVTFGKMFDIEEGKGESALTVLFSGVWNCECYIPYRGIE